MSADAECKRGVLTLIETSEAARAERREDPHPFSASESKRGAWVVDPSVGERFEFYPESDYYPVIWLGTTRTLRRDGATTLFRTNRSTYQLTEEPTHD